MPCAERGEQIDGGQVHVDRADAAHPPAEWDYTIVGEGWTDEATASSASIPTWPTSCAAGVTGEQAS
jgi:hypothetical protein